MQVTQKQGNSSPTQTAKLHTGVKLNELSSHLQTIPIVQVQNSNEKLFTFRASATGSEIESLSNSSSVNMQLTSQMNFWSTFRHDYDSDKFYQYFIHYIENDIEIDNGLLKEINNPYSDLRKNKIKYVESYSDVLFQKNIQLKKMRVLTCALNHFKLEEEIKEASYAFDFDLVRNKEKEQEKNNTVLCNHLIRAYAEIYKEHQVNKNTDLKILTSEESLKKLKNKMASSMRMIRSVQIDQKILQEKNKEVMNLIKDMYKHISSQVQSKMDVSLKKYDAKEKIQVEVVSDLFMKQLTEQESLFCDNDNIENFDYPVSAKHYYVNLLIEALRMKIQILRIKVNLIKLMIEERKNHTSPEENEKYKKNVRAIKRKHLKMLESFIKHALEYRNLTEKLRIQIIEEPSKKLSLKSLLDNDYCNRHKIETAKETYTRALNFYKNVLKVSRNFTDKIIKNRLTEYLLEINQSKAFNRMIVDFFAAKIEDESDFITSESLPRSLGTTFSPPLSHFATISCNQNCAIPSPEKINILRHLLSQPFTDESEDTLLKCRALFAYYEANRAGKNFIFKDHQGKNISKRQIEYWSYCFLHGELPLLRGTYQFNNQGAFRAKTMFRIYSALVKNPRLTIEQLSSEYRKEQWVLSEQLLKIGFTYDMDASTGIFSWKLMRPTYSFIPTQSTTQAAATTSSEAASSQSDLFAKISMKKNRDTECNEGQSARKKIKYTKSQNEESTETDDLEPDGFNLLNFLNAEESEELSDCDIAEYLKIDDTESEFSESFLASLTEDILNSE